MRFISIAPAAAVFAVATVVVGGLASSPQRYAEKDLRALGQSCPAGYRMVDAVQFAQDYRPGMSEAEQAAIRAQYPNPVCVAQKSPESLMEFTQLQQARAQQVLQLVDAPAERRLRDVDRLRRLAKTAQLRHGPKGQQVVEIKVDGHENPRI